MHRQVCDNRPRHGIMFVNNQSFPLPGKSYSCIAGTSIVDVYPYGVTSDFTVYLIDTPGCDDTRRSDTEVLSEIAAWLTDSYKHEIRLHGIIYLHRISDVRMQGSAKKNLVTFKELCGEDALKKVVLASTMWDIVPAEKATKREQELKDTPEFWGWMLQRAKQMVDEGKSLDEISAGQGLKSELLKERQKLTKERQDLQALIKEAQKEHDVDTEEALQEESDRYADLIKRAEESARALKITMENLVAKRDLRVEEMTKEIREVQTDGVENPTKATAGKSGSKTAASAQEADPALPGQRPEAGEGDIPAAKIGVSVSVSKPFYILQSPLCWSCNEVEFQEFHNGKRMELGCLSAVSDQRTAWIARYDNNDWRLSAGFERHYPFLAKCIKSCGLDAVKLCALGPSYHYYTKWKEFLCFGYGSSFLVSYGFEHGHLGWTHDLQGFYPSLNRFLNNQKKSGNRISIHVSYERKYSGIPGTYIGVACDT
ncbi:hypothetical protein FPHYL_12327 [Fusarium phyllophilum]|uniref:G domain-containing protein n=1 Tax=Fusarium phyllophilum TaxID=47803 RepID=A0A8H5INI4_9HYPO|nr:hypothetical protein FPHYL_12327 [Fusarium phyllophilum]